MNVGISRLADYGVIGIVVGILFFILWRMLVWVMAFVRETIQQHNDERITWLEVLREHRQKLERLSNNMDEHDKRADERGKYIREEHKQMIETLGRINGYKKD